MQWKLLKVKNHSLRQFQLGQLVSKYPTFKIIIWNDLNKISMYKFPKDEIEICKIWVVLSELKTIKNLKIVDINLNLSLAL